MSVGETSALEVLQVMSVELLNAVEPRHLCLHRGDALQLRQEPPTVQRSIVPLNYDSGNISVVVIYTRDSKHFKRSNVV